ncbi:MAG TPA: transcription elongation factor GreA [Gemmataceae bacterium]|jgi:transcription elongation factor GreA|nr:transcription elongation factor GreA [Gemmataceae bacterium]
MADDRIPMTREGYEKLKAELAHLKDVKMIEVTKRVAAARDLGDLSENAEYHAAREDQGLLQAQVDLLQSKLNKALIVDPSQLPKDSVVFGSKVTVKDMDEGDEETFELVGPGQDDPANNKILTTSPIGQGLLGRKKGEVTEIQVPKGVLKFKIMAIEY